MADGLDARGIATAAAHQPAAFRQPSSQRLFPRRPHPCPSAPAGDPIGDPRRRFRNFGLGGCRVMPKGCHRPFVADDGGEGGGGDAETLGLWRWMRFAGRGWSCCRAGTPGGPAASLAPSCLVRTESRTSAATERALPEPFPPARLLVRGRPPGAFGAQGGERRRVPALQCPVHQSRQVARSRPRAVRHRALPARCRRSGHSDVYGAAIRGGTYCEAGPPGRAPAILAALLPLLGGWGPATALGSERATSAREAT